MSNLTRTYVTFAQLQPLFTTVMDGVADGSPLYGNDTDKFVLLLDEPNYVSYKYRATSTIILMVCAWTLLIVGFIICCCAQCFGGVKRAKQMLRGENIEMGDGAGDRTNPNEPVEICRRYPSDFEVESLPSYTIVSGLPTYDDALEEFRKAGIILSPPMPVVKIFERDAPAKDNQIYNTDSAFASPAHGNNDGDNVSLSSTCTCGATNNHSSNQSNSNMTSNNGGTALLTVPGMGSAPAAQVIELSPEQLAALSQKRLSLQITFNNSVRRNSRPRGIDLYRQVNRNNMLRSHALNSHGSAAAAVFEGFPQIHRASSSTSLSVANELNMLGRNQLQHLQHRGSLY